MGTVTAAWQPGQRTRLPPASSGARSFLPQFEQLKGIGTACSSPIPEDAWPGLSLRSPGGTARISDAHRGFEGSAPATLVRMNPLRPVTLDRTDARLSVLEHEF